MHRIISAFRLLMPRIHKSGPMRPGTKGEVPAEAVGDFLNAIYVAVEQLRGFGLADEDFGGKIDIVERKDGERANGRYFPKDDRVVIYYPPVRTAPDYPWTIVHEIMHRVWVKHLDDDAHDLWELLCEISGKPYDPEAADALAKAVQTDPDKSSLWFYFNKHYGKDPELFSQWLRTRKVSDSFPSKYANTDPAEAFAEVAANVIFGRGHAGKEISRSGSMVRKLFLHLMAPIRHKKTSGGVQLEHAMFDKDENFLQTQVDFGYLRVRLPRWVQKNLKPEDILELEHRPHVTIYYGADKRDLPQIEQIIKEYGRPVRALLGEFDIFEHEHQDVLYIKLVGDSLHELHNKIKKLPHSRPYKWPKYVPHLTIAYMKKGTARKYIGTTPFRMVVSARGLTVINREGIEQTIRAVEPLVREPLLLAGR